MTSTFGGLPADLIRSRGGLTETSMVPTAPLGDQTGAIASMEALFLGRTFAHIAQLAGAGNWTVPANVSAVQVLCIAGGGGGGAVGLGAAATATSGQPGGNVFGNLAVTPGGTVAYSVGAKGLGGVAGNNNGSPGADSTFGPFIAKGGLGGIASIGGNAASPTTIAVLNTQADQEKLIPSVAGFLLTLGLGACVGGSAGVGGVTRSNGHGSSGLGGNNAAGGNATGFGQSGGGAGSLSSLNLAGGDGSPGTILILY